MGPWVLKGASCDIQTGEKVGLVGRTGSGKSTMLLGLTRLLETSGDREGAATSIVPKIEIAGRDITTLPFSLLRSQVVLVPQEPWVLSGTLRENLDPYNTVTDDVLVRILDRLQLGPRLVQRLPSPLNSILDLRISEGGSNLSQGEKQLLCLTRGIVRKPKIILLDENMANLDEVAEHQVQTAIQAELQDATVFLIAHRMSSLKLCQRLLKVDDGQLREVKASELLGPNPLLVGP